MPDDYYVSQYSGEEIDALLGSAGAGSVRYDAAQTLTDAQKTQARGNIAAAPDGFGLGSDVPSWEYKSTNGDNITATGWYVILPEVAGFDIGYSLVRHESYSHNYSVQTLYLLKDTTGFGRNVALRRVKESNTWYPWEWVNPPMRLGVEYRTTERYLDKPVYCKLVDFGTLAKTEKNVSISTPSIDVCVSIKGIAIGATGPYIGQSLPLPLVRESDIKIYFGGWANSSAVILSTNSTWAEVTNFNALAILRYTKSTD